MDTELSFPGWPPFPGTAAATYDGLNPAPVDPVDSVPISGFLDRYRATPPYKLTFEEALSALKESRKKELDGGTFAVDLKDVKLIELRSTPSCYQYYLKTIVESRKSEWKMWACGDRTLSLPDGETIPAPWEIQASGPGAYPIPKTDKAVVCPRCGGAKQYVCTVCSGAKQVVCPKCHGTPRMPCPQCQGRGEKKCPFCHGSGHRECRSCYGKGTTKKNSGGQWYEANCDKCHGTAKVDCDPCRGAGSTRCSERGCNNGYKMCGHCGQRGQVTCGGCSGTGIQTCATCEGYGRTAWTLYLVVSYDTKESYQSFFPLGEKIETTPAEAKWNGLINGEMKELKMTPFPFPCSTDFINRDIKYNSGGRIVSMQHSLAEMLRWHVIYERSGFVYEFWLAGYPNPKVVYEKYPGRSDVSANDFDLLTTKFTNLFRSEASKKDTKTDFHKFLRPETKSYLNGELKISISSSSTSTSTSTSTTTTAITTMTDPLLTSTTVSTSTTSPISLPSTSSSAPSYWTLEHSCYAPPQTPPASAFVQSAQVSTSSPVSDPYSQPQPGMQPGMQPGVQSGVVQQTNRTKAYRIASAICVAILILVVVIVISKK